MRYALLVSYDGTDFAGWQVQPKKRTVQGVLEEAAEKIFHAPVKITGSGRTDAGVHAEGQVCDFDAETSIPAEKIRECFNAILPPDVRVLQSAEAPEGFDCTRNAKKKTYCYRAYVSPCELPLKSRYAVWLKEKVGIEQMKEAASLIVGEHDFKAFCAAGSSAKTSVRTVFSVDVVEKVEPNCTFYEITVCGNGFLYNMVRIIAGQLFAVGCGRRNKESIISAFETGDRTLLDRTMPAHGLTMIGAQYDVPLFGGKE